MAEEATALEKKKQNALIGTLLGAVKLDWIRPLIYKIGGRKVAVGGGALAVINSIVATEMTDWPKAIACFSVAMVAGITAFAISYEDGKKVKA